MGAQNGNGPSDPTAPDASSTHRSVEVVELDDAALETATDLVPPTGRPVASPPPSPLGANRRPSMSPPPTPTHAVSQRPPPLDPRLPPRSAGLPGANPAPPATTLKGIPPVPPSRAPSKPQMPAMQPPGAGVSVRTKPPPSPPVATTPPVTTVTTATDEPREKDAWTTQSERIAREADAVATTLPARAALLLTALGRALLDVRGDAAGGDAALARAAALAGDARFVALSRRWSAERKTRPGEILSLTRAELPLAGDPRERVALLWQIAAIEEGSTGQIDAAERALREAVGLEPQDLALWDTLATLYARRKQWREAVTAWEALANGTDDAAVRGAYQTAVASAREVYLDDVPGARAALERALEADPTSVSAQAALEPLLLRARAWVDYARVVVAQGDQVGEPSAARECYERAGDVLWECAQDGASAGACYERAAAMAPREIAPLEKFAAVLEGMGRYADLPRVYERMLVVVRDPVQQAAVLLRIGALYETRLDKPDEARKAYKRSLEAAPTFVAAAQALAALYRAQGKWSDLAALELVEADRLSNSAQRASRYVAIAEVHDAKLGAREEACALWERALALDPSNTAAFDALDAAYRQGSRWDELIALYEKTLTTARDPRRVRALGIALGELYLAHTDDAERAARVLRDSLAGEQDGFPTLVQLARALATAGTWAEHVEVLEQQAKLLRDEADLLATLYRVGSVIETRLGDPKRALAAYQRVLERAPRHELALVAVSRVQAAASRWEDVVATERRLLELASRPEDASTMLFRIGRIAEERLGRPDDAVRAYEEALARLPSHAPASAAIERLLRANGRYPRLAEVFEKQAEVAREPGHKARALCHAATVYELHLNDPARAIGAYDRALAAVPGLDAALWGSARIREASREWPALEVVLSALVKKTTHSGGRLRLLARLARLHEYRLGSVARASELYEEALATGDAAAPLAVDRLRTARTEARRDVTAMWFEHVGTASRDPRVATAMARQRALAAEYGGGTPQEAADAYGTALSHAADDRQALDGLLRALARGGDTTGRLPEAMRARARLLADAPSRTLLLFVAGAMHERAGLGRDAEAEYAEAIEHTADFLPALDGLRRLRAAAGDHGAVARLAARAGAAAVHPQNTADARMEAADLYADTLHDPGEALSQYRAVLNEQPGHARAFARATQILEAAGDWPAYSQAIGAHVDALQDPAARARLLASRAGVYAEKLGNPQAAVADLTRALTITPDEPALLGMVARLHERLERWQDAAQAYERLARVAPEGALRREALLAQSRIWTQKVKDYDRARAILEEVLRGDPVDRTAATRLAEVVALSGDHARARDLYQDLARAGAPQDRARALLALSEVQRHGLADLAQAHASAGHAMILATNDPSVVPILEEHFTRSEDWGAFTTLGDETLARAPANAPGVLPLHMALARAYRDKLGALDAADRHLRTAIESFPVATEPRIALAYGLLGGNDHAAVAELRRVIEIDPSSPAAYRGLLTVCQRMGLAGAATMLASTAALLGESGPLIDGVLSLAVPSQPIAGSLPPEDALTVLVGTTRARFVRRVLAVLDPYLHEVFPAGQESVAKLPRLPDNYPSAMAARAVSSALAVPSLVVLRGTNRAAAVLLSEPRSLVLGPDHLADSGAPRVLFDSAYICARIAAQSAIASALPPEQVLALLEVATDNAVDGPGYRELRKRLGSALPRKWRKELERIVEEGGGDAKREYPLWDDEERKRSLRTAVVFCRDLRVIAQIVAPEAVAASTLDDRRRALAANGAMADALRFVASEACWAAHRRVYGQP